MSDEGLSLGEGQVARGTTGSRRLPTGVELYDGTSLSVDVFVLRGARPGPVAYVGSGVHGDEAGAVAVSSALIRDLRPQELTGTLLVVPVQNPLAFWAQHRLPLALLAHSPLDQGNVNVFQSYPGDPGGTATERIAHFLFELMSRADAVVDLHTPTTGGRYLPFAFVPPARLGPPAHRARELARAFGVRAVLGVEGSTYTSEKTPHVNAARKGIAAFGVEMGEGGRVEPDVVAAAAAGIRRVLVALGMLPRAEAATGGDVPEAMDVERLVPVRATRAGSLAVRAELGTTLAPGGLVAEISDLRGDVVERLTSPVAGMVLRRTTFPVVSTGEQVVQIAVPRPSGRGPR